MMRCLARAVANGDEYISLGVAAGDPRFDQPQDSNATGVPDDSATPLVSRLVLGRLPRVACGDT